MAKIESTKRLSEEASRVAGRLSDEKRAELAEVARQVEEELGERIVRPTAARIALAKLKVARLREGLSLADLSTRTGIERGNLSRLENTVENVELNTLERLADALGYELTVELTKREQHATASR